VYGYLGWTDEWMMTMMMMGNQIVKSMLDGGEAKTRQDGIALLL
jgi:hypothetical protein